MGKMGRLRRTAKMVSTGTARPGFLTARAGLGKSSMGMNAVSNSSIMPAARQNPNAVSSPRMNAISPSAKLSIGGGSGGASGVNAAVGNVSGVNRSVGNMNPAMSGRMQVPGAGGESGTRLPTSGAAVFGWRPLGGHQPRRSDRVAMRAVVYCMPASTGSAVVAG